MLCYINWYYQTFLAPLHHEDGSTMLLQMLVTIYQSTCSHIPEDMTLHQHQCVNLKFHKALISSSHSTVLSTQHTLTRYLAYKLLPGYKFCSDICHFSSCPMFHLVQYVMTEKSGNRTGHFSHRSLNT